MTEYGKKKWKIKNESSQIIENKKNYSVSKVTKIEDEEGVYILKELPWYCSNIEHVNKLIGIQKKFVSKGVPIPLFFKTIKEKNFVFFNKEGRNFIYTLQEYIPGTIWTSRKDQIEKTAIFLSNFHKISKEIYLKEERALLPRKNIFEDIEKLNSMAFGELLSRLEKPLNKAEENNLIDFFKSCHAELINLKRKVVLNDYRSLLLYNHGDFNPSNLIFRSSNVVAIIDFDNCGLDNPINDIARFILHICYFKFSSSVDDFICVDIESASFFLKSYFENTFFKIQKIIEYFPFILRAIAIELSIIYILRGYFTNYQLCHEFFDNIKKIEESIMILINRDLLNGQ